MTSISTDRLSSVNNSKARRIPLSAPDLTGNEAAYLVQCVESTWVSSAGAFVNDLEKRVAALAERDHGIATSSGTSAIQLALIAAGVKRGDHVIIPNWTFAATANAVHHAGATPILVDVSEDTWTIDPELAKQALESFDDTQISAMIPVDALGHPANMDELSIICERHGIAMIEDAAGAIGARYRERPAGTFGDLSVFSFNGNKTVTAGGGGMIVTNNMEQAEFARHLSSQARTGSKYEHDHIGFNFRMTNLNAALGVAQVERLDEMLAVKQRIALCYDDALTSREDLSPMPVAEWASHNYWLYTLLAETTDKADHLVSHLNAKGVEARHCWRALSGQTPYASHPAFLSGVSESLTGRTVSLPSGSGLSLDDVKYVSDIIANWAG